jgi:WD40 repeat protein
MRLPSVLLLLIASAPARPDAGDEFDRARAAANLKDYKVRLMAVAYSPDGKTVATGSQYGEGEAVLWDVATGRRKATLADAGRVNNLAFSPDGKRLFTGGTLYRDNAPALPPLLRHVVAAWDATTGKTERFLIGASGGREPFVSDALPWNFLFPHGNDTLLTRSNWGATRWDLRTGEKADVRVAKAVAISHVTASPDGRWLAADVFQDAVRLVDAATWKDVPAPGGQEILARSDDRVWAMAFTPDGKTLVTAAGRGAGSPMPLILWDVATRKELARLTGHRTAVEALTMSGDGKLLASADQDGRVVVWDLAARKPKATLKGPRYLRQLAFTPDDSALACPAMGVEFLAVAGAAGNAFAAEDRARAEQWAAFEKVSRRFAALPAYAPVVAFTADAGRFAAAESERQVRVWDTASLDRPVATFDSPVPSINAVTFSPDGKRLAVGGGDYNRRVPSEGRVWDLATGKVALSIKTHTRPVTALAFSPDGAVVASGADHWDHTVRVTDLATGKQVATYDAPELSVASLAHHPKEKVVVSTGFMHRDAFFAWDYGKAGKADVLGPRGDYRDRLAFAADGKTLVRFQDNRVEVWDWPARKLRTTVDTTGVRLECYALSADGTRAAIGGLRNLDRDWTIRVCDLMTGKCRIALQGPHFAPCGLAFARDGHLLAVATAEDGLRLITLPADGE